MAKLKDWEAQKKTEQRKKIKQNIWLIISFIIIPGIFFIFIILYPISWIMKRQDIKFITNFKSNISSEENIGNITAKDIKKFAKLNNSGKYKGDLNKIWKAFHERLDETLDDVCNLDENRLNRMKILKAVANVMPDKKPEWWAQNWWPDNKYKSSLEPAIGFVESWQQINKGDVIEVLNAIYSSLESNKYLKDPKYSFVSKKCMVLNATGAVLKQDNESAREIIETMLSLEDYKGIPLPFSFIYRRLRESQDNLRDWELVKDKVQDILTGIIKESEDRSFALEKVLNEIPADLPAQQQRKLLNDIVKSVKEEYLFDLSSRAWPSGIGAWPLAKVLEKELNKNKSSRIIIRAFSSKPVYMSELKAISSLVNLRYYQYELIAMLRDFTEQMKVDEDVKLSEIDRLEKIISGLSYFEKTYLKKQRFGREKGELNMMRLILKRWNYVNNKESEYELDKLRERVNNILIRYCRKTGRAHEGDCASID